MRTLFRKLGWRFRRRRLDADLRDELEFHLAEETDARQAAGASEEDARRQARRDLGPLPLIVEDTRAAWGWIGAEHLLQDLRSGSRIVTRSPGLSTATVILIALVIGGNTTIYSMVHTILTKPAPRVTAARLVTLQQEVDGRPSGAGVSLPDYEDYAASLTMVRPLVLANFEAMTVTLGDGSYAIRGASVTPNYFDTLGVGLALGRSFTEDEYQGGSAGLVAVIGYRFWQDHFHGAADALGETLLVNGHAASIAGVAPEGFRGVVLAETAQVWIPLVAYARASGAQGLLDSRERRNMWSIGRLAPGVSLAAARAEAAAVSKRLAIAFPETNQHHSIDLVPYSMTAGGDSPVSLRAPQFLAVFSVVTLITLVIVCANVSNLMLARVVSRQREIAVRLSLGSSRLRLVRLLIAEAGSLSLLAWVVACLFAVWVSSALPAFLRAPVLIDFAPDWRVLSYAMVLAVLGAVAFSCMPAAVVWRQSLQPSLRNGEPGATAHRARLSAVLTVIQLACSVLLLTMAGLGQRSLSMLSSMNLGFNTDHLILLRLNTGASADSVAANGTLTGLLRQRLAATPGARGVTYASGVPPYGATVVRVRADLSSTPITAERNEIGPEFFEVLGAPRVSGREFTEADLEGSAPTVVINRNLADTLWPGLSAVGRALLVGDRGQQYEVVGVSSNALVRGPVAETRPYFVYFPQRSRAPGPGWFYVRHEGSVEAFLPAVRAALKTFDSRIPVETALTVDAAMEQTNDPVRIVTTLLGLFAAGSLTIAAVGLYAVLAFNIRRRFREFGIRLALGASASRLLGGVLREGMTLTAAGLAAGFLLSMLVATLARGLLVGVTPTDLPTYGAVLAVLAIVACIASYLPARRAALVDPVQVLRQD